MTVPDLDSINVIDREWSRSTCLDDRDNIGKVSLSGPFSDEFREIVVPFCGDYVGFKLVCFRFGTFRARGFELAHTKLGECEVVI